MAECVIPLIADHIVNIVLKASFTLLTFWDSRHGLRLEQCHFFSARCHFFSGLKIGTGPSTGVAH